MLLRHRRPLPLCVAAAPLTRRCAHSSALTTRTTLARTNTLCSTLSMACRLLTTRTAADGRFSTASSSLNAPIDVPQLRVARDARLKKALAAKRQQLEAMERVKAECDKVAYHYPDVFMAQLFAFLALQAAVLFDWTYVHFDWNFVEPITYLIGYSATWIAIAWYGTMQHEFGYQSLRSFLQSAKCERLYKARQFDLQAYEALQGEVAKLDRVVRSLEELEI
ncbi:hypothetical protein CUR178_06176 [Leishmania enriettii]|uniref:Calcium uniporter protein C-terminal domain-containing protein n=1 Tax=Leishmania enriettii TaxID=5663 RepID=A0A836KLN1_LEIEN|nr:hypothetical protein CUR178_06176 [Leishmania enriettii]